MTRVLAAAVVCAGVLTAACARAGDSASGVPANWPAFDALIANAKQTMMADPNAALEKARKADAFAQSQAPSMQQTEAHATSLWLEGEALTRINRIDEAHAVLGKAIALASADGKTTRLDGDLALSQARLADASGDIALSLKSYHRAYDIFRALNIPRYQSIALQCLGNIYGNAHDFDHEIQYYQRASQVYSADPALELSADNNIGLALEQLGRYDESIKDFGKALKIATALDSPFLEVNILTSLAATYAKSHRFNEAENAADRALKLARAQKDGGLASFAWGYKAEVEYERGRLKPAVADMDRAFAGIDLKTTTADFRDMHEFAYEIYKADGDYPLALAHLEAFKRLDDQGRTLTASANLALMSAQFDFANQQLEIEHLKSEQLKRDISLRESRAAEQRILFTATLFAGLLLILWISLRHRTVRRHRNELAKTLGERNIEIDRRIKVEAQLRLAMEAAEQANRAKSHFLANMSHELRTPLNVIIGFSNLMAGGKLAPAKAQEYAQDINSGGRKLLVILNDILDMARIDAGNVVIRDDDVNLAEIAGKALAALDDELPRHGKTVRIIDPDKVHVRGDEGRLRQVAMHLLSNAVKFTAPDGLIEIRIERVDDGGADFVVRDNGIGIPQEKLTFVLEPFGQGESAYARLHGGIGLGLPIVKSLTELHGGLFTLESELGGGTTARVHLPADRVLTAPAKLAQAS